MAVDDGVDVARELSREARERFLLDLAADRGCAVSELSPRIRESVSRFAAELFGIYDAYVRRTGERPTLRVPPASGEYSLQPDEVTRVGRPFGRRPR